MLEKSMYDSWASRIRLFIKWKKHGRMILDSIDNGSLVYPTVEEDYKLDLRNTQNSLKHNNFKMTQVQVNTKFLNAFPPEWSKFVTDVKLAKREGHMAKQYTQPKRPRNFVRFKEKLMLVEAQEAGQILDEEQLAFIADLGITEVQVAQQTIPQNSAFQTEDLIPMTLIVPYSDTYPNDMINQDVQEMPYSEQTHIDTNSSAPNNLLVLSLIEQMTDHVAILDKENQTNKMVNESLTAELKRYKACVAIFEQRQNVDLNKREKLIDSQMDELIRNRNAKLAAFQQEIDTLKETLSNSVKEKESLSTTLNVFKTESKEKESKYIEKDIALEKQNKEVENIICKLYRSTQAMHMLTKPQVFYDDTHKQALGYQNQFHLKKAQRIKPTLYDGSVIAKEHDVIYVIDDEETLILEEVSRSKMLDKQNDPISIKLKINISPIDYSQLNKIKEDYGKRFVTKKELSAEQAFRLKHSSISETPVKSHTPIRIEAPSELPKVSLVNASLKKLKYHLASFDKVVKKRTTSDAITTGVNTTTSVSGSKPSSNTKKNRRPPSSDQKNKVEEHPKKVKSSLNKMNSISEPISNAHVKHSVRNAKFESICAICNKCLFDANHDMCVIDYVNDVNVHSKSKSKRNKMRKVWKPMGQVFSEIGYSWKPIGRTFTIVRNKCPLTRFTSTKVVPTKETTNKSVLTLTQGIIVYNRRSKAPKLVGSSSKSKIRESRISNSSDPTQFGGSTVSDVPTSSLNDCMLFGNDHIAKIIGYGYHQMGNVTISWVYYVEGLGHNLFSGSRGSNLYTFSMDNLMLSSPICLLSKASKTKSWLWHQRLSHLNFDYITSLAKQGLVRGHPKLKHQKDHLCSACALVRLNATVRNIRTDNGTEFVNQTLRAYYEEVGISHQTFVARTPQQNGVVERRNHTLAEATHTLKPDLSYLHVFGALCYTTNDGEDLGKLKPKADIGIFVGYALVKKAFRIYNKRTRMIIETTHVDFDELIAMASKQFSSGPEPKLLTPTIILTVIAPEPVVSTGIPSSTIIDQDAPSTSTSQINHETPSPVIPLGVEEADHDIEVAHIDNNPYVDFPIP
ncbi:integrase, catalytic region, zinc finger, CCHC-type containing protein [Tanacetum coccineum]